MEFLEYVIGFLRVFSLEKVFTIIMDSTLDYSPIWNGFHIYITNSLVL